LDWFKSLPEDERINSLTIVDPHLIDMCLTMEKIILAQGEGQFAYKEKGEDQSLKTSFNENDFYFRLMHDLELYDD
jgi:hypothetical protein